MASFKRYTRKKDGKKFWSFQMYLGMNEDTGKPIRISRRRSEAGILFKTKKEAEVEAERIEAEYKKGKQKELLKETRKKDVMTFQEVADEWLVERYKESVKESTYLATSEGYLKLHINPVLGKYKINKINKRILEESVRKWSENYIKSRYNLMVNYSKRIFKYALEEGYIKKNPFDITHVPRLKGGRKKKTEFYDKHELMEFLNAANEYGENGYYWNAFFHLLAFSGLRSGEVRSLTWDDLDFKNNTVSVNKTLSVRYNEKLKKTEMYLSGTTKNGEDRVVVLDRITMEKLMLLRQRQPKEEQLVFPPLKSHNTKWIYAQTVNVMLKRIAKKIILSPLRSMSSDIHIAHCYSTRE